MALIPKRSLGQTGMEVSILGLGTVKLGRNEAVKYPHSFELPNDKQANELLAIARDNGINLVDTAPSYGTSEERLGHLLSGQRKHWLICTKVGEEFTKDVSSFDFTPEHTRFSVERSLKRLNTDMLDIVLVHSDGNDVDIIKRFGTLDALAELKRQGKIRAFGMSTKTLAGGLLAVEQADVVMITWNLQYHEEIPVADYCLEHGKGVLIKKILASGHSTLSPGSPEGRLGDPIKQCFDMVFNHPGVSSAIVGTINPQHLLSNIAALQSQ
jgi:aryl-alcohol dehydrogenase-like predicted oxidoreductase